MKASLSRGLATTATQRLMLRGLGLFVLVLLAGLTLATAPAPAAANPEGAPYTGTVASLGQARRVQPPDHGAHELTQLELRRAQAIMAFSAQYAIPADLAALIYDTALREGLDPDLGFRLVKIESNFKPGARSSAGAIGLAQVMLPTAVYYDRSLTAERLAAPEVNLQIGFRYLRYLLERYEWDLRLALLAYNRGPTRVGELLARGLDPRNGYATSVTAGYRPTGPSLQ